MPPTMKKFHFSLETLLELRIRKEDELKQLLGKKHAEVAASAREADDLSAQIKTVQADEREKRSGALVVDILSMRSSVSWRNKLKMDLLKKAQEIQELQADAEYIRMRLLHATQARRALEILREKRRDEWRDEYRRREGAFNDEVSTQGFLRKRAEKAS